MRSILSVSTAASVTKLTTLERVKLELEITDGASDAILNAKIDEASSDCEAFLGFRVARETVAETFWHESGELAPEYLLLDRTPTVSITSVVRDDITMDATSYRLDPESGQLYALDWNAQGWPWFWYFYKGIVVSYVGGYLLPGETGRDLPAGIEGACIELVSDFWHAKGRDPSVREEEEPGVYRTAYWVGAVGESGELPPRVQMKLAPFRRAIA